MALKITRTERLNLDELLEEAKQMHVAVNDAIRAFNEKRQEYVDALSEIRDRVRGEFDDRSDRWRESDKAGECEAWIGTLDDLVSDAEYEMEEIDEQDWINNADELADQPEG